MLRLVKTPAVELDAATAETSDAVVSVQITGYSGFATPPEIVMAADGSEPQREAPPAPALRLLRDV